MTRESQAAKSFHAPPGTLSDMEYAAPLPDLHGGDEGRTQRNLRRWLLMAIGGFGAWSLIWALLVWGIYTDFLSDDRLWLSMTLVGVLFLTSLAPFAPLLAGLLYYRTRSGKIIFWVSGLHALLVIASTTVITYGIMHRD